MLTDNYGWTNYGETTVGETMEKETITKACTSRSHGDNLPVFSCPGQNCLKVYTQMRHMEAYIGLGNHKYNET